MYTQKIFFLNKIKKNKKKKKKIAFRVLLTRLSTRTDGLCCLCQHWRENRCCCRTAGSSFCRVRPFFFLFFCLFVADVIDRQLKYLKKNRVVLHTTAGGRIRKKNQNRIFFFLADYNLLFLRSKKRRFQNKNEKSFDIDTKRLSSVSIEKAFQSFFI